MSKKPNRVVIVTGLSDAYITEVRAERPQDVTIIIYSLNTLEGTVYESKDIEPLGVVQEICPECKAMIPPDGCCWYCEDQPSGVVKEEALPCLP